MTNKLVVIINSLKATKINKILLYEISCTKLQLPPEPLTRGLPPPDPRSLCPLYSTEFVEPSLNKIPAYATELLCTGAIAWRGLTREPQRDLVSLTHTFSHDSTKPLSRMCCRVLYQSEVICHFVATCPLFFYFDSPQRARAVSFTRFLDHTQRRITVGRAPPQERSARRWDLYLHNTQHSQQTTMLLVGSEPTISAGERSQTYGYTGTRNDTTQLPRQTPVKEPEIKNITVYVSGCTETDTTGMLSPLTAWRQQSEFVSSRQSGQISAAVHIKIRVSLKWTKRTDTHLVLNVATSVCDIYPEICWFAVLCQLWLQCSRTFRPCGHWDRRLVLYSR